MTPQWDMGVLKEQTIDLQNILRSINPRMPTGEQIVDEYVLQMFERCKKYQGAIFVAEIDWLVVGFIMVLTRMKNKELDKGYYEYGLITDLFVHADYRRRGIGRKLLSKGEDYAMEKHVKRLKIGVLANNVDAKVLYSDFGFTDYHVQMEKELAVCKK